MIPKRAKSLAVVEGVLSRFFQTTATASAIGHVCQARFVVQADKGQCISHKSPGERELGVVQEAQSRRPIPMRANLLRRPASPLAEMIRSGTRYSPFRGCERSLDPIRLRRAVRHSQTNSVSPKGLRQPSAFRSDFRRGKVRLAFSLYTASLVNALPKYASLSASQWLSKSGINRPPLRVRCIQTCLRTIGLAPPQSNLEKDRCSANRCTLGRGITANR